jgi:hypothetical protein
MTTENNLSLVKPDAKPEVVGFYNQAVQLKEYAVSRVIATNDDLLPATDDLAVIGQVMKGMESCRKEYLKPFQDHVKETNDAYKMLMEPIQQADKITRDKMTAFIAEQNRKRKEAEAIEAEKLALAKREAELKGGEITIDLTPVEKPVAAPQRVTTDMGSAGLKDHWELVEVTDFALLPDEYKMVDAVKLGKVIRAGLHNIPGCRIENTPSLALNIK